MLELVLVAAGGGALVAWGFVIRAQAEDRDAYLLKVKKLGLDPAGFESAYVAHRNGARFNGNLAIGFGAFLILGAMYNLV